MAGTAIRSVETLSGNRPDFSFATSSVRPKTGHVGDRPDGPCRVGDDGSSGRSSWPICTPEKIGYGE